METPAPLADAPMAMTPPPSGSWVELVLDGWRRGQRLSAVGPGSVDVHLDHARRLADVMCQVATPERCLDLGSGAGIPGLALAGLLPDTSWTLLDASQRRVRLLEEVVARAGWHDRVDVIHARAETAGADERWRGRFDTVTARLFGAPSVTAECGAPFLRAGGRLLVTEPPSADAATRWPPDGLRMLGLEPEARFADPPVQVLRTTTVVPARFPRRAGVAAKRPLW